jgi:hypothetical protein
MVVVNQTTMSRNFTNQRVDSVSRFEQLSPQLLGNTCASFQKNASERCSNTANTSSADNGNASQKLSSMLKSGSRWISKKREIEYANFMGEMSGK